MRASVGVWFVFTAARVLLLVNVIRYDVMSTIFGINTRRGHRYDSSISLYSVIQLNVVSSVTIKRLK